MHRAEIERDVPPFADPEGSLAPDAGNQLVVLLAGREQEDRLRTEWLDRAHMNP